MQIMNTCFQTFKLESLLKKIPPLEQSFLMAIIKIQHSLTITIKPPNSTQAYFIENINPLAAIFIFSAKEMPYILIRKARLHIIKPQQILQI